MGHERIKLNDSTMDIVIKMAEGNYAIIKTRNY